MALAAAPADPVAQWVRATRDAFGLTTGDLARRTGLSLWHVEAAEGGRPVRADDLRRIADALGLPIPASVEAAARAAHASGSGDRSGVRTAGARRQKQTPAEVASAGLVLGSVVLLLGVRFFTEVVPILPRAANFVDIPVLGALLVATVVVGRPQDRRPFGLLLPSALFLAICALSVLTNFGRVDIAPALLFVYGFASPFAVFWSVHRIWPAGRPLLLSRLLIAMLLLQFLIVALVNVPEFVRTEDPDVISGTFGENPYQLVFFLVVSMGLMGGIYTFERERLVSRAVPVFLVAAFATIFLAQYRSILVTTLVTVLVLGGLLSVGRPRGALVSIVAGVALVATLFAAVRYVPALKFDSTIEKFQEDPTYYASERFGIVDDVMRLYGEDPRYVLTGTGPGTFSSRAWNTFASFESRSDSNVAGSYVAKLMGGEVYRTDVSDRYVLPRLRAASVGGSRAVRSSLSTWTSLAAETGVPGLLAILTMYAILAVAVGRRLWRSLRVRALQGPVTSLLLAAGTAFFVLLQMGVLENWLEVARVTFFTATIAAVAIKEFDALDVRTGAQPPAGT